MKKWDQKDFFFFINSILSLIICLLRQNQKKNLKTKNIINKWIENVIEKHKIDMVVEAPLWEKGDIFLGVSELFGRSVCMRWCWTWARAPFSWNLIDSFSFSLFFSQIETLTKIPTTTSKNWAPHTHLFSISPTYIRFQLMDHWKITI